MNKERNLFDEKIIAKINEAKKENISLHFKSKTDAGNFLGISRTSINKERLVWFRELGIIIDSIPIKKHLKLINNEIIILKVNEAKLKGENLEFESIFKASLFFKSSYNFIVDRLDFFKELGVSIHNNPSNKELKKITDKKFIDKINASSERNKDLNFESVLKASKFFKISANLFTVERIEKLKSFGIYVSKRKSKKDINDQIINKVKESKEKNEKLEFETVKKALQFFNIKVSTDARLNLLKNLGVKIIKNREIVDKTIINKFNELKVEKLKFSSILEASKYFNISAGAFKHKRIENLKKYGIEINKKTNNERKKRIDEEIEKTLILAKKNGEKLQFNSSHEITKFFKINKGSLTNERKELLEKYGVTINKNGWFEELVDKKVHESNLIKEELEFRSFTQIAKYFGISSTNLTNKRIEFLRQKGIKISRNHSAKEKRIIYDKKILDKIHESKLNNINLKFDNVLEICKYFNVNRDVIIKRMKLLRENDVIILNKIEISKNLFFFLDKCKRLNLKIESKYQLSDLSDLSEEFFGFTLFPIADSLDSLHSNIFYTFSKHKIKTYLIKVLKYFNSKNIRDFSIYEFKFELFLMGIYFSEETIKSNLMELEYELNLLNHDDINKRFRLVERFLDNGFISINYLDDLPNINNCINGDIFIHSSIKKEDSLQKLWENYISYYKKRMIQLLEVEKNDFMSYKNFIEDKNITYEYISVMILFCSKKLHDSEKIYKNLHTFFSGFFLFLVAKGLAVSHPKYIEFMDKRDLLHFISDLFSNHIVISTFNEYLQDKNKRFNENDFSFFILKFACSVKNNCNLQNINTKDIHQFLNSTEHLYPQKKISFKNVIFEFLRYKNNIGAIEAQKTFSLSEKWYNRIYNERLNSAIILNYKELLDDFYEIIEKEHVHYLKSIGVISKYIDSVAILLKYLSLFPKKLMRDELLKELNPIISRNAEKSFKKWFISNYSESKYYNSTSLYLVLFENTETEYKNIYSKNWIEIGKQNKVRTLIREGIDLPILMTIQKVVLESPITENYYSYKTCTHDGTQLDMSWWKYNFSPIPLICCWLITKLPRRKKHIINLDVNKFIQYDINGNFEGIFFNTDKNRDSKEFFINKQLLKYIFSDKEIELLINYTNYIKLAYSYISPIKYSGNSFYEEISPLFPHHSKNDVISEYMLSGYMNKVMLKSQYIIRKNADEGIYNSFYSNSTIKIKNERLKNIELLFNRSTSTKKIPINIEELDKYTIGQYDTFFTTIQGIHNFRHAGATALLHKGLSIVSIRHITGHSSTEVLFNVYLHPEEDIVLLAQQNISDLINNLSEPIDITCNILRKDFIPLIKSNSPKTILDKLHKYKFLSLTRTIKSKKESISTISNGLELASKVSPLSWEVKNFGICTFNLSCPDETRSKCCLCPYIIFNASNIEGVIYEINQCLYQLNLLSLKIAEILNNMEDSNYDELMKVHNKKLDELFSWYEMYELIEQQLISFKSEEIININEKKTLVNKTLSNSHISFRPISIDEGSIELLIQAKKLKINDIDTENILNRITLKMTRLAAKRYDNNTLKKLEEDSLNWFLQLYKESSEKNKFNLLKKFLIEDKNINNILM